MRKSKRYDFLSNINNKYSIRKFTVGAASILVGATLIFGTAHNEAKAAEDVKTEEGTVNKSNQTNSTSSETLKIVTETPKVEEQNKVEKEAPKVEEQVKVIKGEAPREEDVNGKNGVNIQSKETDKNQVSELIAKDLYNNRNDRFKTALYSPINNYRVTNVNKSSELRSSNSKTVVNRGTNNFKDYGDVIHQEFPEEFPGEGTLTAINTNSNPRTGTSGALEYKNKIDFNDDFTIIIPIANDNQGNTTGANGWGFIFTQGNGQDYLSKGGILRNKGLANSSGFKVDTSYNNVRGVADSMDADKTNNLRQIGGAAKIGYGTFVSNGADGISRQVGSNALDSRDKPINKIQYADNTNNHNDGKFHGQRLNDVILKYNASRSTLTATYAGKTWEATTNQLGIDKTKKYNFLITSSQMSNRYAGAMMRTNLNGITITTPQVSIVDGEPEVTKSEIPFKKKREFNPKLKHGEEKVIQVGQSGEKTVTTPVKINSSTGEIVERGNPVESITKEPVDEITQYGGQKVPQGHKDEYDPNLPVGSTKDEPGQPGIKNPETGEVVTPPVDDVTKHGPKAGEPIITKEKIPFEKKREFNPSLNPGEEKVIQVGQPGEKTITTPITINPVTGEKVGEGDPVESITKEPVDEITQYGGQKVPQGHKDEYDPNLPVGTTKEEPGQPGIKNPETGEVVTPPVDDVTKHGPKAGEPIVSKSEIPFKKKREFNPNLNPGEEKVTQVGQPGEKTITTPITINPVTGEKVGEGDPVESITKEPVDEITQYGGQEVPQGHKDEYDPNLPVGSTKDEPGQPGIKNPETGEVVTPPVDDVTKHGPKAGEPIVSKSEIPFEKKREFNPNLNPGEEKVTQVGQPGEKTITTPIT
ncbi:YSIRK-type signal peptide-containing protein, partial [Staphylococcus gallinarum]